MKQSKTAKEMARMLSEACQGGLRTVVLICDNRRPLRDFIIKQISEDEGGFLCGHEKGQKRMHIIRFREIVDVR